jgi:type II secretory pathway pseudopilin PulG
MGHTKSRIEVLRLALEEYQRDKGSLPTTEQSREALLPRGDSPGYIRTSDIFVDGWGRRFVYRLDTTGRYELYSVGPNGIDEKVKGDDISPDGGRK